MKKIAIFLVLAGFVPVLFAAQFEGVIDYEIRSDGGKVFPMSYRLKGSKVRVDYGDKTKGAGIMDTSTKVMWVLQPSQKAAIRMEMPKPQAAETGPVEFKKTSRTETIAGRKCTVYTFKTQGMEGESCNAEGMGTFMMDQNMLGAAGAWQKEAAKKGLFPLKVTSKHTDTGKGMLMIATKIEPKSLPDADFQVPAGYKIVESGKTMPPAMDKDAVKKMMDASPAERQRMIEEMKKQYGAP